MQDADPFLSARRVEKERQRLRNCKHKNNESLSLTEVSVGRDVSHRKQLQNQQLYLNKGYDNGD